MCRTGGFHGIAPQHFWQHPSTVHLLNKASPMHPESKNLPSEDEESSIVHARLEALLQIDDRRRERILEQLAADLPKERAQRAAAVRRLVEMLEPLSKVRIGVLRCDYTYTPGRGDAACSDSFLGYAMQHEVVEGWTFAAAKAGPCESGHYPASEVRVTRAGGEADADGRRVWDRVKPGGRRGYHQVTEKPDDGYYGDEEDYTQGVIYRYPPEVVLQNMREAVQKLTDSGVAAIVSDVGFAVQFQQSVSAMTTTPVALSSLLQIALLRTSVVGDASRKIAVLTADSRKFDKHSMVPPFLMSPEEVDRHIEVLPGEETKAGQWVNAGRTFSRLQEDAADEASVEAAMPDIIDRVQELIAAIRGQVVAVIVECTEMSAYTNALRQRLGVPVYDIMTLADWVSAGSRVGLYAAHITPAPDSHASD